MAVPEFYSGKILYPAIGVLIGLSALFSLAIMPRLGLGQGKMVGKPAPDFTLPVAANGESGARMQLSELRGRPVVVDFWAQWCEPCKHELPELDKLHKEYARKGVRIVTVNIDKQRDNADKLVRLLGLQLDVALDPSGSVAASYDLPKMPTSYVLDKKGVPSVAKWVQLGS